jgi:hypothetical protein
MRARFENQDAGGDPAPPPQGAPAAPGGAGASVGSIAKKFAPGANGGKAAGGGSGRGGAGLSDTLKQLSRAGVSDQEPKPGVAASGERSQHKVALAALERKAERSSVAKSSATQHAQALRGLQQAQESSSSGAAKERVHRQWEAKGAAASASAASAASGASGGSASGLAGGVAGAKQAFAARAEEAERSHQGSQMEEALRKLHGKGVVPTKLAYGTKSSAGTQHSESMRALMQKAGTELSVGGLKKSELSGGRGSVSGRPEPAPAGLERGPSQRQMAMQALQGNLQGKD